MYVVPSVELVKVEELFHLLTLVEFLLVNRFVVVRVLKRKERKRNECKGMLCIQEGEAPKNVQRRITRK